MVNDAHPVVRRVRRRPDAKERDMRVLSRKVNESIVIGDGIMVTVVDIRGDKVRLGVDAAGEVKPGSGELFDALVHGKIPNEPDAPK